MGPPCKYVLVIQKSIIVGSSFSICVCEMKASPYIKLLGHLECYYQELY